MHKCPADGLGCYGVTFVVVHASLKESIVSTLRTTFDTRDVLFILVQRQSCCQVLLLHRKYSTWLSCSCASLQEYCFYVGCRSILIIFETENLKIMPSRFCNKSGKVSSTLLNEFPLYLAAALHTRLTVYGLGGLMTGRCVLYQCLTFLVSSSSLSFNSSK